jgi:hypothetical protein
MWWLLVMAVLFLLAPYRHLAVRSPETISFVTVLATVFFVAALVSFIVSLWAGYKIRGYVKSKRVISVDRVEFEEYTSEMRASPSRLSDDTINDLFIFSAKRK